MKPTQWDTRAVPVVFLTDTARAVAELTGTLARATKLSVDTETVIIRNADGSIAKRDLDVEGPGPWRVMSIAAKFETPTGPDYRVWVLDMAHIDPGALNDAFKGAVAPYGWNAPFDRKVLCRAGLIVRHWRDAMLIDAVLRQGAYFANGKDRVWYYTLDTASQVYLGLPPMAGKDDTRLNYDETTPLTQEQIRYAGDDALITLWVGEEADARAEAAGLTGIVDRTCRAQSFVKAMRVNGFPFDGAGYQHIVDNAKAKADAAAERVAVLTGGLDVLRTLVRWAVRERLLSAAAADLTRVDSDVDYVTDVGLPLLHDPQVMSAFLTDVATQRANALASLAAALGCGEPVDDLFSAGKRYELPFKVDDETTIRRWLNKAAPQFVAEVLAAAGSTTRGLTKANDLQDVYTLMQQRPADVTTELANAAKWLQAYYRYGRILDEYGSVEGPVRLRPTWNLSSTDQVKNALNTYAQDAVLAYTARTAGSARLLSKADTTDNAAMKLIGGPLCTALLEYREHEKMVSTYGDGLLKFINPTTGRVHAEYIQELTATGRLASNNPNAQNLAPEAKPFITGCRRLPDGTLVPLNEGGPIRVIVAADLSQAELRYIADKSGDDNMLEAFRSGEDLHERTASLMFSIDLKVLAANPTKTVGEMVTIVAGLDEYARANPTMACKDLWKQLRQKAKAVSFGYAYGLGAASLAMQLTVQGVETTVEQAQDLLRKFDEAYPKVAAWMAARKQYIQDMADAMLDQSRPSGVNFEDSWRLHKLYYRARSAQKALKAAHPSKHLPTMREVAESLLPDTALAERFVARGLAPETPEWAAAWEETRTQQTEQVAWALGHYGSAVLNEDGTPWTFESRNSNGRRRLFQVGTEEWTMSMVACVARSRRTYAKNLTKAWETGYNEQVTAEYEKAIADGQRRGKPKLISLTKADPRNASRQVPLTHKELEKALDTRELRISFVSFVLEQYGSLANPAAARDYLFRHAMADQIRAAANQYRNHPIQSGVGDAVLEAFYRIDEDLYSRFPTALAIQSVHDSIVIECDLADAPAVREMLVRHMEAALQEMCPNVPAKADGDIQVSLDDHTKLTDDEVKALLDGLALAA